MINLIKYSFFILCCLTSIAGCNFFTSHKPIQLWSLQTEDIITGASLSPNNHYAAVHTITGQFSILDLIKDRNILQLEHFAQGNAQNSHLHFSANNDYILVSNANYFSIIDIRAAKVTGIYSVPAIIKDAAISSDGRKVALALSNYKVLFQDFDTKRRLEFLAHKEKVNSVAISPNGKYCLSGGNDHKAFLWNTNNAQIIYHFDHNQRINKVVLDDAGRLAFISDRGKGATIWDLSTGKAVKQLETYAHQLSITAARFSSDGKTLVTGSPNGQIIAWDTKTGTVKHRFKTTANKNKPAYIYDLGLDAKGYIFSVNASGNVEKWKME